MNKDLECVLEIRMPDGTRLCSMVRLMEYGPDDAFAPLPRDREIPWEVESRILAERKIAHRRNISKLLATQLADKMLELIESKDPVNGFSPEEWRAING